MLASIFVSRWILPNQFEKSIVGDVVLITGGGSGIGRLMAVKLAKLGAIIVTWDVNQAGNEETVRFVAKSRKTDARLMRLPFESEY